MCIELIYNYKTTMGGKKEWEHFIPHFTHTDTCMQQPPMSPPTRVTIVVDGYKLVVLSTNAV